MSKLTIADAAQKLGVSKEAIHNRIRRGSLQSVVEDGVKHVILDVDRDVRVQAKRVSNRKASHDDRYYRLLEEQNSKLQQRVEALEDETRSLRDQKEQMLVEERKKIEQIYKDKDEQLKNILNAISTKFMLSTPEDALQTSEELLEAEIEEKGAEEEGRMTSLNKYLKTRDLSKKKVLKIKEKFKKIAKTDPRVITIGRKYYIDLQKYDYRDLSL